MYQNKKQSPMQDIKFDVMIGDKFICTLTYKHCRAFKLKWEDIVNFLHEKRPSLKDKQYAIYLCDTKTNIY